MSARLRCWIHEDCVANPELGAACGPNVLDLPALDSDRWYRDVYSHSPYDGLIEKGDGCDGIHGDGHLFDAPDGDGQVVAIDIECNSRGDGFEYGDVVGRQWP